MKLIIKEYLTMLKESKELDILLPDLLLQMGFDVRVSPSIGVRQYGVDVEAVKGENGEIYLFTIKRGDIDRKNWDGTPQSVRQSLNEIEDVYIPNMLAKEYKNKKKNIIVVTGGEMNQKITPNWEGYKKCNKDENISFDFWGGNQLSLKIERYLLNEHLLSPKLSSSFRKILALLEYNSYEFTELNKILEEMFIDDMQVGERSRDDRIEKKFRTVNLMLNIIYYWAKSNNNIKPAILCAEKITIASWGMLKKYSLFKNNVLIKEFKKIYDTLEEIYGDYFEKIKPYTEIENGLCINVADFSINSINLFEILGFLGIYGFIKEKLLEVQKTIIELIRKHKCLLNPCFDNQIIDITLAVLVISKDITTNRKFLSSWITSMIECVCFAYKEGMYFPISSDDYDDLFECNINKKLTKEELFDVSTLIPILLQLCYFNNLDDIYDEVQTMLKNMDFGKCDFQIWYPNKDTKEKMYKNSNAVLETGCTDSEVDIQISAKEMKNRIQLIQKNSVLSDEISAIKYGFSVLPLIISRHYRMPVFPMYWQDLLLNKK
ncbi:MAG: hypothetical protein LE169_00260 [Endomicrobium sp.]|nr:hypothetical protein [Endomicrobium sp.]